MTKTEVGGMLGEPDRSERLVKQTEVIWGPVEGLWSQLELGDALEIWVYEDSVGRKELYFLPESETVAGEFFWFHDQTKNPVF